MNKIMYIVVLFVIDFSIKKKTKRNDLERMSLIKSSVSTFPVQITMSQPDMKCQTLVKQTRLLLPLAHLRKYRVYIYRAPLKFRFLSHFCNIDLIIPIASR